jgi:hypothetical protein
MSVYRDPRSPYWQFYFRWRGHRFFGSTKATTRREAEKVEAAEREKAKAYLAAQAAARTSLRLDDVAGRYWSEKGQHHAASRNIWKRLSLLIKFFGKDKLITDITDDDVRSLVAWRRGHRKPNHASALISPGTVNLTIMQLKTLFATLRPRAQEPEWRKHWLPVRQEHPRELMGDEGERLEAQMRKDYAPLFAFAMATGMRQSECLLRWSQVDWGARQNSQERQRRQARDAPNHADHPRDPVAAAWAASRTRVQLRRGAHASRLGEGAALPDHARRAARALASAAQGRGRRRLPLP